MSQTHGTFGNSALGQVPQGFSNFCMNVEEYFEKNSSKGTDKGGGQPPMNKEPDWSIEKDGG